MAPVWVARPGGAGRWRRRRAGPGRTRPWPGPARGGRASSSLWSWELRYGLGTGMASPGAGPVWDGGELEAVEVPATIGAIEHPKAGNEQVTRRRRSRTGMRRACSSAPSPAQCRGRRRRSDQVGAEPVAVDQAGPEHGDEGQATPPVPLDDGVEGVGEQRPGLGPRPSSRRRRRATAAAPAGHGRHRRGGRQPRGGSDGQQVDDIGVGRRWGRRRVARRRLRRRWRRPAGWGPGVEVEAAVGRPRRAALVQAPVAPPASDEEARRGPGRSRRTDRSGDVAHPPPPERGRGRCRWRGTGRRRPSRRGRRRCRRR